MIEISGTYNHAVVYADDLEKSAEGFLKAFCDSPVSEGSKIRIMPDVHAGTGCAVGTTMTVTDKVIPNLVGVDIGCGMLAVQLKERRLDLPKLDSFIRKNIPSGQRIRGSSPRGADRLDMGALRCIGHIDTRKIEESLGTLGGGNHFIEVDRDEEACYLIIHSGSRNLGLQVAEYYQKLAYEACGGREQTEIPYELAYLTRTALQDYLHDMNLMQEYAALNRRIIKEAILDGMKLKETDSFSTVHNYIDLDHGILRKGAVSAQKGERLLIPMNMRDGCLVCTGLGNEDWNCSAPHGAGRLLSRRDAKNAFSVSAYKAAMKGIFTTSVTADTLDECPMAYKPMDSIIRQIQETVAIDKVIKPIYNFKASEDRGR